ncbi:alanine dehydrogenase [Candidatus Saccharibacteria bacterium]|nr:alanine dehydrogenase [Candidatus Saccharibacteria bacterium]
MRIGCVKEIKNHEYRVGMTPGAAKEYVKAGHEVFVQAGAGIGSEIADGEYEAVGVNILGSAEEVWGVAEMIVKVKEPLPTEYDLMREGQILYTYFHFAASEELTRVCLEKKIIAVAYETMVGEDGSLPLLKPMSEVAGSMAPLMGAYYLMKSQGGRGVLATGVPGVLPANVVVFGGGVVGRCAAQVAAGMGAKVTVLDTNLRVLTNLGEIMPANVFTRYSDAGAVEEVIREADIVVGAVLLHGAKAPKLVTREQLKTMKHGAVIVDVAIDQGGCFETSRATTHSEPIYEEEGVVHYCVANMPGAYARTSTIALGNATLEYGLEIAGRGIAEAIRSSRTVATGVNTYWGRITYWAVAEAFGMTDSYTDLYEMV